MALSESGGGAPVPISYGTRGRNGKLKAVRGPVARPAGPTKGPIRVHRTGMYVAPKSIRKGGR
jgi:hypothetical protein